VTIFFLVINLILHLLVSEISTTTACLQLTSQGCQSACNWTETLLLWLLGTSCVVFTWLPVASFCWYWSA